MNYYQEQLNGIMKDSSAAHFKFVSDFGTDSKWMYLNDESASALLELVKAKCPKAYRDFVWAEENKTHKLAIQKDIHEMYEMGLITQQELQQKLKENG